MRVRFQGASPITIPSAPQIGVWSPGYYREVSDEIGQFLIRYNWPDFVLAEGEDLNPNERTRASDPKFAKEMDALARREHNNLDLPVWPPDPHDPRPSVQGRSLHPDVPMPEPIEDAEALRAQIAELQERLAKAEALPKI